MTVSVAPFAASGPCVLIVDDDEATRHRFARALGREGLTTIEAKDGERALELVRSEPVALVLLDSGMPGLSGIDVIHQLRSDPQQAMLPVVMVTAASERAARIAGLEAGADDYVAKPVDIAELVARVHTQLRRHGAWRLAARSLHRWASMIEVLAQLPRDAGADESADRVCELLAEEFPGVAIAAFADDGASVLSARGGLSRAVRGVELDAATTARLRELCARGPWSGPVDGLEPFGPLAHLAFGVPLSADGRMLGALLLGASQLAVDTDATLQATAIAIGSVVTTLLAPGLEHRHSQRRRSDDRERILHTDEFHTHFQPVIDLGSGRTVGYEALTRWVDGVAPDVRLNVAREAGCADELERAMIANALVEAAGLPATRWVSVNASAALVLGEPGLATLLADADRAVVLELTEREPVDDYPRLRRALAKLGDHVLLAVDDAGAGYASLRHILSLEPSLVKLDREWIQEIDKDRARQALLVGLQHFAHETRRSLIAEGIETAGELETVTRLGIRFGQGYFLGRPAPLIGSGQ